MLTQAQYIGLADKLCRMGLKAKDLAPKKCPLLSWEDQRPSKASLADAIVEYLKRQTDYVSSKQIAMAVGATPMTVGMLCRAMPALQSISTCNSKLWKWGGTL
jgi:hypothetical protein